MTDDFKQLYKERIHEQEDNLQKIYSLKLQNEIEQEKNRLEKRLIKEQNVFKENFMWISFASGLFFLIGAGALYVLLWMMGMI